MSGTSTPARADYDDPAHVGDALPVPAITTLADRPTPTSITVSCRRTQWVETPRRGSLEVLCSITATPAAGKTRANLDQLAETCRERSAVYLAAAIADTEGAPQ